MVDLDWDGSCILGRSTPLRLSLRMQMQGISWGHCDIMLSKELHMIEIFGKFSAFDFGLITS